MTPSEATRQRRYAEYGITIAQYTKRLDKQGARCAICSRLASPKRRLDVDHSHVTGEVRGLLCNICNSRLGWFESNRLALADYLGMRDVRLGKQQNRLK